MIGEVTVAANVPAVSAAIRILERLAAQWPQPVSPSALVDELGLNRSTCYNILATLQQAGWASSPGERAGWTLGPRLLTLTGVSQGLVAEVVQEEIDQLSADLGFVTFAAERDGSGGFTVVAKAERQTGIRVTVGVGDRFPFSAPALLQAFAAWIPRPEIEKSIRRFGLTQHTEFTVTDPDLFFKGLEGVRREGFSRSLRQMDLSQAAVAATVFNAKSQPLLSLCVLAFSSELDERNVDRVGSAVADSADAITERIGGVLPPGYRTARAVVAS
jgi:DNA-binding IclR family transcriptional regulator